MEFPAEFGQDSADRFTSRIARGEQLNPDARGVDLGPDRQWTQIFRADLEGHDVLPPGCPHESEKRFGQLGLEGRRVMGRRRGRRLERRLRSGLGSRLGHGLGH